MSFELKAYSGEGQIGYWEKVHHCEGGQALGQAPQGSGHGLSLPEFKKNLDCVLSIGFEFLSCPVWS